MENFFTLGKSWLQNISEIERGNSAILGGNRLAFYGIHCVGLVTILISVISSVIVITSIWNNRSSKKWDFSDRFPLYLAIADGIWGVVNLTSDHIVLLVTKTIPDEKTSAVIGLNVGIFIGYQQAMCSGLATYTYLKVVHRVSLHMGRYEWKLQVFCITLILFPALVWYWFGAFGCSGYWFLVNLRTQSGKIFQYYIITVGTVFALSTILAYKAIRTVVDKQRKILGILNALDDCHCYHSTASQCLTTFVYISLCLYCPMTLLGYALTVQYYFGVLEPLTAFLMVIIANSSGWANAWAYFHNKAIKERRRHLKPKTRILTLSPSSSWANNAFE